MKNIQFINGKNCWAVLLLLLAISSSCKKLIEIPANPGNAISTSHVFADSSDIASAVVGCYNSFQTLGGSTNYLLSGAVGVYTGLSSDEIVSNQSTIPEYQLNSILITNPNIQSLWSGAYSNLYQINACIAGITSTSAISARLKTRLIAELKVCRAQYYFNMVNLWAGVPLVTTTDFTTNAMLPRAPVDSVYSRIIADLTSAQTGLTVAYPSAGRARANLYVADALLAKVYLYRQRWADAASTASLVINAGLYSLAPDLSNVFIDGSSEAIWQLPAKNGSNQTGDATAYVPTSATVIPVYSVNNYLLNAFEQGDKRRTKWIGANVINGVTYTYPYKYKNRDAAALPLEDFMFFRLGELYLIRAEAYAHANNLSGALNDLNMIRSRAGLPNSTASSQQDILNAIMHERQTELFCEWGNRWFDLKRTGTIDAVLGAEKPSWKPTAALYPVPNTEIHNNTALVQNPGY